MKHCAKELHVVSNGKMPIPQLVEILADIHPYVAKFHLREKQKSARDLYQTMNLLTKSNVPVSKIVLNDRVDVALVTGAAGVQLAWHSLDVSVVKANFPRLTVGCSIHSIEEGIKAEQSNADYLLYGHIFPSGSKPGLKPKGLEELKKITGFLSVPVIAIGGILPENAKQVLQVGAKGIAVMSGIFDAHDPVSAVKAYKNEIENGDVESGKGF
ncbi:thiazole tautomerase TenI [Neobacillus sp. SM06]|uniref:thiazole tautomerase TenI n=1 Tax=Neobacillus sp. SM06 TaxID=3422492 RepID=UPI003D26C79F